MQISQYEPMRFAPVELLPPGFTYPGSYVEYTLSESFVDGPHWEWCLVDKESFVLLLEAVRQLYPERILVPFMHVNGDDGVACFDASQPSSDPPVFCGTILEKDASGRGHRWGEYDNFIQWKLLVPERLPN